MDPERNIVLTGFMGTGKTTVGRLLAKELGREFVDTDAVIEERHGPIAEIFERDGEATFRAIERALAAELAGRTGLVISTGGRMLLDDENIEALRHSTIYCLVADADLVFERVTADADRVERPLLVGPDPRRRIAELLEERRTGYARFPQISTDGRPPIEIAREVAALVRAVQT